MNAIPVEINAATAALEDFGNGGMDEDVIPVDMNTGGARVMGGNRGGILGHATVAREELGTLDAR